MFCFLIILQVRVTLKGNKIIGSENVSVVNGIGSHFVRTVLISASLLWIAFMM